MKRELKPEEHKKIVSAVAAGDRIKAMNIYLSATEGNLTEAQNYLKTVSVRARGKDGSFGYLLTCVGSDRGVRRRARW